jgi:2-polyprenyl-6-methoxyphenol hydroxylase-like FAD-dependent oxidoreductase
MVVIGWPYAEAAAYKADPETNVQQTMELSPSFAERLHGATRQERFSGASVAGFFRKPYGPGWALVGDAGYNKDPITAQGISDAFRDAELCAEALDATWSGRRSYDDAMATYHETRDEAVLPIYEFTAQMATLEPPTPEEQQLFSAVSRSQEAMDEFVSLMAGTVSPAQFFEPDNLGRLMGGVPTAGR